jgi:hypothetical protein
MNPTIIMLITKYPAVIPMNDLEILIIALFFGGIAGLIRTYQMHGLKLVAPTITIRDRTLKIRFGWLASVLIGSILASFSFSGIYLFFTQAPPTGTPVEVILWSVIIGWGSLDVVNKWIGGRFGDIDSKEFDFSTEINVDKMDMAQQIMKSVKGVERIHIRDDFRGGTAQIFVVPKPSCAKTPEDAEKIRQNVERIVARIKMIGLLVSVELPHEKIIDVSCKVMVLDVADHDYSWYADAVKELATKYINSLAPGRWVLKNKLMHVLYVDRFVQDIRELETNPPIEDGLHIKIGPDEVARAGEIKVVYDVIGSSNGVY